MKAYLQKLTQENDIKEPLWTWVDGDGVLKQSVNKPDESAGIVSDINFIHGTATATVTIEFAISGKPSSINKLASKLRKDFEQVSF